VPSHQSTSPVRLHGISIHLFSSLSISVGNLSKTTQCLEVDDREESRRRGGTCRRWRRDTDEIQVVVNQTLFNGM
jgi:hypothetical protein